MSLRGFLHRILAAFSLGDSQMQQTGKLAISLDGISRLDGTLLARSGGTDPLADATNFLRNRGFDTGDVSAKLFAQVQRCLLVSIFIRVFCISSLRVIA
jgi:hypothetical protein